MQCGIRGNLGGELEALGNLSNDQRQGRICIVCCICPVNKSEEGFVVVLLIVGWCSKIFPLVLGSQAASFPVKETNPRRKVPYLKLKPPMLALMNPRLLSLAGIFLDDASKSGVKGKMRFIGRSLNEKYHQSFWKIRQ